MAEATAPVPQASVSSSTPSLVGAQLYDPLGRDLYEIDIGPSPVGKHGSVADGSSPAGQVDRFEAVVQTYHAMRRAGIQKAHPAGTDLPTGKVFLFQKLHGGDVVHAQADEAAFKKRLVQAVRCTEAHPLLRTDAQIARQAAMQRPPLPHMVLRRPSLLK